MRYFPKINFFPIITGLGYGFIDGDGIKRKFIRQFMILLYKLGLKNACSIIFQNIDDEKLPINPFLYSFAAEKPNI